MRKIAIFVEGQTELLFLVLMLRMLKLGGRCAVIVPDGVLFGSSKAHVQGSRGLRPLAIGRGAGIGVRAGVVRPPRLRQ